MSEDRSEVPTTVRRRRVIRQTRELLDQADKAASNSLDRLEKSKDAIDESIDKIRRAD